MKKELKGQVFIILFSVLLFIILFFFLGVGYPNLPLISKVIMGLIFSGISYFLYKKSFYNFFLGLITGFSVMISLGVSFGFHPYLNFIATLISIFIINFSYNSLKIKDKYPLLIFILYIIVWIILSINVSYRHDWFLENLLTIPFVVFIFIIYKRFKLSNLSYSLIFIFMTLHIIGTHYTYAEVPFGFWIQNFLGLSRNHYDRIVHFSFGLLLAYPVREISIRIGNLKGAWALYIPIDLVLALSALYEIIEWIIAIMFGGDLGIAYLGTQGDVWDAQKDMAFAGLGAVIAMFIVYVFNLFYRRESFHKEIKESLKVKSKEVLGEKAIQKISK